LEGLDFTTKLIRQKYSQQGLNLLFHFRRMACDPVHYESI
jgi:hypothetical protein